jgi:hypothetical protein
MTTHAYLLFYVIFILWLNWSSAIFSPTNWWWKEQTWGEGGVEHWVYFIGMISRDTGKEDMDLAGGFKICQSVGLRGKNDVWNVGGVL